MPKNPLTRTKDRSLLSPPTRRTGISMDGLLTFKNFGLVLFLIQGSGLSVTRQSWGLDQSWIWLSIRAAQLRLFGDGSFLWTHGPLFFLDTQQLFWKEGLFLSLIFRIVIAFALYLVVYKMFESLKNLNDFSHMIWTLLLSTFIFQFIAPTFVLVIIGFAVFLHPRLKPLASSRVSPYILGLSLSIEFYTKFLYLSLLGLVVIAILLDSKNRLRNLLLCSLSFILSSTIIGLLSGFRFNSFLTYVRASFELTLGYKAMSIEVPDHTYEYLTFSLSILLLFLILRGAQLSRYQVSLIILVLYVTFNYGFTRHDGHSSTTFFWVFLTAFIVTISKNSISSWVATGLIAIIFIMATNYSLLSMLDLTSRIQSSTNYLRLLDPRYLSEMTQTDKSGIGSQAMLSQEIIDRIGNEQVAIMPWDQLTAFAYGLNLKTPPIPQPYSAYTPWLDDKNAEFFSSSSAPTFVLLNHPNAIDGRNFWWESPRSQLAIFCNYKPEIVTQNWLLLDRRERGLCKFDLESYSIPETGSSIEILNKPSSITLIDLSLNQTKLQKMIDILLKPMTQSKVIIDEKESTVVVRNSVGLLLSVPENVDYPAPWSVGIGTKISSQDFYVTKITQIPTN